MLGHAHCSYPDCAGSVVLYDAAIEFQRDPILKSHMSGLDLGQSVDGIPDSTRHRLDLHLSMESRATAWKGRDVEDLSTASAELVVKNLHCYTSWYLHLRAQAYQA